MWLFRRSSDIKQVSPVNFLTTLPPPSPPPLPPPFRSILLFPTILPWHSLRFSLFVLPPIWVILSSRSLRVSSRYRTRQEGEKNWTKHFWQNIGGRESSTPKSPLLPITDCSFTNSTCRDNLIAPSLCCGCQAGEQSNRLWPARRWWKWDKLGFPFFCVVVGLMVSERETPKNEKWNRKDEKMV